MNPFLTRPSSDSFDYAPYLRGTVTKAPRDTIVHNTKAGLYAIRHGDFVLVDAKTGYTETAAPEAWNLKHGYSSTHDSPAELYDMRNDPGERKNIAAEHPEKVAELKALLKQIRAGEGTAPRLAGPASSDSR